MNAYNQGFASSHQRQARESVWAQFSRRRRNDARDRGQGNDDGKGGGQEGGGQGGGHGGGQGGGHGGGQGGGGHGGGNDDSNDKQCRFGGSFPQCSPAPRTTANTQPAGTKATVPPVQQTPGQPDNTPVVNNPPATTAQPPEGGISGVVTEATSIPINSQSPSLSTGGNPNQPVRGGVSGSPDASASTSLDQYGLPFGTDPTSTITGASASNTAPVTPNGAISTGADVGAIVGGVVGTISLVLLLLIGIWYIRRRHKNRSAPSSEFLAPSRIPFSGSTNFQFRRIDDSNYDAQSRNTFTNTIPTSDSAISPRSFPHMREKSSP